MRQVVGVDRLAPFGLEARDVRAVSGRECRESLAEIAANSGPR